MKKILIILASFLILAGCKNGGSSRPKEIIIFHAGSLSVPFKQLAAEYEKKNPGINIILESAGSLVCARKITELNISHLLNRYTRNLSAGELQRVALARTLVTSPGLLLLDEPLASIDASLKDDIKKIFRQLNKKGLTIIHVTHDYDEAVSLAGKIGVIHNGRLIQEGLPEEVFGMPINRFVARYAGIRNFFRVKYLKEEGTCKAICEKNLIFSLPDKEYPVDGLIIIRSNTIIISVEEPSNGIANRFKGFVKEIIPTGHGMEIMVDAGEIFYINVSMSDFNKINIKENSGVWISFPREACIALIGNGSDKML